MRILLVEDDDRIAREVQAALTAAGYQVEREANGESAWHKGNDSDYAAVILDLGLPGLDGLAVLKRWRAAGRTMPVLVLTARGDWVERVEGIDAGADDYLPKPFQIQEALARLRAILRRRTTMDAPVVEIGGLMLEPRQMRISLDGEFLALTPQEFRLLSYLMFNAGRVVSHGELLNQLYADDPDKNVNVVEVLIGRVRRKLSPETIQTRRGQGYVIEDKHRAPASGDRRSGPGS